MNNVKELQVVNDDNVIRANIDFCGEYVSGADSGLYDKGFEDGKNSVVDLGKYAKTITFSSLNVFGKEDVELTLDNITTLASLFDVRTSANKNTTVKHLTINSNRQPTSLLQMIYSIGSSSDDEVLERLTLNFDTSKCVSFKDCLCGKQGLKIIDGEPLNFSANTQSSITFLARCAVLRDFNVVKESIKHNFGIASCSLLSAETIQSIIDGLADLTGQTTQALDFHSDIVAKLTEEQISQITNKNWEVT